VGDDLGVTGQLGTGQLVAAKGGRVITVCIPARDEAATVDGVVAPIAHAHLREFGGSGLVDEILVVDDGSRDATAEVAAGAGATVLRLDGSGGKGQAMRAGLEKARGDLLVYLDADVENTTGAFVSLLLEPILVGPPGICLVKAFYERPLFGEPGGGGRVTELVAKPLIEVLFPQLGDIRQPLAGETAAPRSVLENLEFADGYGVELGLLVDIAAGHGVDAIAQVDLGTRIHRNRPLIELRPQATEILRAALARAR
jgi:glucosyl-3-phosphoglycerate synthase